MASNPPGDGKKEISNMAAALVDDLFSRGVINASQAKKCRDKYGALYQALWQVYRDETMLYDRAKTLKAQLEQEKHKIEQKRSLSREAENDMLQLDKQDREGKSELTGLTREQTNVDWQLEDEIAKVKRKKEQLEDHFKAIINENNAIMNDMKEQRKERKEDLESIQDELRKEMKQLEDRQNEVATERAKLDELEREKQLKIQAVEDAEKEPVMLQKKKQGLIEERNNHQKNYQDLVYRCKEQERENQRADEDKVSLDNDRQSLKRELEKAHEDNDGRRTDKEYIRNHNLNLGEDQQNAEIQAKEYVEEKKIKKNEVRKQQAIYKDAKKEVAKCIKAYNAHTSTEQSHSLAVPSLKGEVESREKKLADLKKQLAEKEKQLTEIAQKEDLFLSQYLTQLKKESDTKNQATSIETEKKSYEDKIIELRKDEAKRQADISEKLSQRQALARKASKMTAAYRLTREELKIKKLICQDLKKIEKETGQRLRLRDAKYKQMKNARNKAANQTQNQEQELAEMKEKIKILQNEVEILRAESQARDRALGEEMRIHQKAKKAKDAADKKKDKMNAEVDRKCQEQNQQEAEVKKQELIIQKSEEEMLELRTKYARAVDKRNLTGIQLIDRNDECCILTYKKNIQDAILKKGNEGMKQREAEMKVIENVILELRRKIQVGRMKIPTLQVYAATRHTLAMLEKKLESEKRLKDSLVKKLETPESEDRSTTLPGQKKQARCRKLGGKDPDAEQLAAKTELLEERLNDKKEQLLEKELVLDEVKSLTDKLRMRAAESRGPTLQLAQKVNEAQAKIRDIIRKMMATVSELSMYQATAMKLEGQKVEHEKTLLEARERMDQGQAPTEFAQKEWFRLERDRLRRKELMEERARRGQSMVDDMTGVLTRTTAQPRPGSYISQQFGLPKPYGSLAPFHPTVQGATMRHIRNPQPKEIIL